jgi:hypothetical protein
MCCPYRQEPTEACLNDDLVWNERQPQWLDMKEQLMKVMKMDWTQTQVVEDRRLPGPPWPP